MSYVEGTLSQGEEIKEKVRLHWVNYLFTWFLCLLVFLLVLLWLVDATLRQSLECQIFVGVAVLWAVYDYLRLATIEMVITNKRVICKKGIISVKTQELKTNKIESVEIKQSILGRIFGYGTLMFSGTGTAKVRFAAVDNPWVVKSQVETIIESYAN